jgi:hypothetical protein
MFANAGDAMMRLAMSGKAVEQTTHPAIFANPAVQTTHPVIFANPAVRTTHLAIFAAAAVPMTHRAMTARARGTDNEPPEGRGQAPAATAAGACFRFTPQNQCPILVPTGVEKCT